MQKNHLAAKSTWITVNYFHFICGLCRDKRARRQEKQEKGRKKDKEPVSPTNTTSGGGDSGGDDDFLPLPGEVSLTGEGDVAVL